MGDVGELVERLRKAAPGTTLSMQVNDLSALREAADLIESLNSRTPRITNERGETLMDPDTNTPLTWEQRWRQTEACFIDAKRGRMAAEQALRTAESRSQELEKMHVAACGNADTNYAKLQAAEQALRTAREALEQINAVCTDNLAVPTANTRMALDFVRQVAVAALTGAGEDNK